MNRPLLLLICDFLLLSMFAMARFDVPADAVVLSPDSFVEEAQEESDSVSGLVKTLQESLAIERMENELKTRSLNEANENLAASNMQLDQLKNEFQTVKNDVDRLSDEKEKKQSEIENLQSSLSETQSAMNQFKVLSEKEKTELQNELSQRQKDLIINETKLREAQLDVQQKESLLNSAIREQAMLEQRLIDVEQNMKSVVDQKNELEEKSTQLARRTQLLDSTIEVLQSEKKFIATNLQQTKESLSKERELTQKLQSQAASLTSSVASLANKSDEITQEIRRSSPKSPHEVFNDFLNRAVVLRFEYSTRGLVGNLVRKEKKVPSVLFKTDLSNRVYAMCHIYDTPFEVRYRVNAPIDVRLFIEYKGFTLELGELSLHQNASHFVIAEIPPAQAFLQQLPQVYKFSNDPFQHPEIVVVQSEDEKYGLSPYSIIPGDMKLIRLKNGSVISSLLGDFKSKRGDLIFSQGGEFLGILHNGNESLLLDSMETLTTIQLGNEFDSQKVKSNLETIFKATRPKDIQFPRTISP